MMFTLTHRFFIAARVGLGFCCFTVILIGFGNGGYGENQLTSPLFDPEQIQIHAIAWSEEATKRIAVVEDQILHIGEAFRGAKVAEIHPEAVDFYYQGEVWTLKIKRDPDKKKEESLSPDFHHPPKIVQKLEPVSKEQVGAKFPWVGLSIPALSNIRSEPDIQSAVVFRIQNGKRLLIDDQKGHWLKVRLKSGKEGWIHERLVGRLEPE